METVRTLADPPPDLVLAADCCYIDQARLISDILGRLPG